MKSMDMNCMEEYMGKEVAWLDWPERDEEEKEETIVKVLGCIFNIHGSSNFNFFSPTFSCL